MIDGIDGSGKSTVVNAWKEHLTTDSNAIFDLTKYWKENNAYPTFQELRSYDIIFSCEPTHTGIGRVIREELINKNNHYSAEALAHAYSLDRLILYTKIIIPALAQNKIIIQDRGVSTSLAYQTAQDTGLTYDQIANLPGNQIALKYRPDVLVLIEANPEICAERLAKRLDKNDNAIFERLETLRQNAEQFKKLEYQKIFTERGTHIEHLSSGPNIDIMKTKAVDLLKILIK